MTICFTHQIPSEYGYVALVIVATYLVNLWQTLRLRSMRKSLGINFPQMYSDKHPLFNCVQRAHQNTMEYLTFFKPVLLLGGIRHPCLAALFGSVFIFARIIYTLGYWTGNPENRMPGAMLSTLGGIMPLCVLTVSTAAGFLGWW